MNLFLLFLTVTGAIFWAAVVIVVIAWSVLRLTIFNPSKHREQMETLNRYS